MADPNTQNPPKQSFEIKPEDLQAQPLPNSAVQQTTNPLNTGNGGLPAETPQVVTPTEQSAPHEIKLGEQENLDNNLDKNLQEQLSETSPNNVSEQDKSGNTKKYLIIGISILGLAVIAFVVYKFFLSGTDTVIEKDDIPVPTNTLTPADKTLPPSTDKAFLPADETPPSEGMKELKEVVDELEGTTPPPEEKVFDEAVLEDFPSLTLPDETSEDTTPTEDTEEKLLR